MVGITRVRSRKVQGRLPPICVCTILVLSLHNITFFNPVIQVEAIRDS